MRLAPVYPTTGVLLNFDSSAPVPGYTIGGTLSAVPTDGPDFGTNVPNWGPSELLYVRYVGATPLQNGRLVVVDKDWTISDMPNTANTGRAVFVTLTPFLAGNVAAQYGWVMRSGTAPVQFSTAATAGAVFFNAAGQAQPGAAAGKQILSATTLIAAASAFTRQITTRNGSPVVAVARVNGMFLGQAVTGTGVAASSTISAIDPGGLWIRLNNNCTATGTVTGTFTPTGFGIVQFDRPTLQGQIT